VKDQHPGKQVEVWFQDEARFGQQGTLTHVWAETGSRPTAIKQTEYDWLYVYASVNPATGESSAIITPTVNTRYMNAHLRHISKLVGRNRHVVLVLDQAGWHVAKALKVPRNITLLHLPPYSPELNPIERVWSYLKGHYLSNRVYLDYDDLFEAVKHAWLQLDEARLCSVTRTSWLTPAA
jgi:transposase